ncbi:hypothetical protein PPMP20_01810 [Paraburkholderia phymatum]|uniref:Uncharacterized protein n=1 Tax=Paraburkholderia phymatum (strain DSM 17167 / CIP 108236 / LMG 21445 / STM815) TaxID=391038 RepID=B2JW61_PARP8|nr:hypothetical protein [Paraburkholderia phymatum]ACC75188.1 hypothetical protein Bphy_6133 [Paraburkholderia phymatum STM815]
MVFKFLLTFLFGVASVGALADESALATAGHGFPELVTVQSCQFRITDKYHGSILTPRAENDFKFAGYSTTITTDGKSRDFGFSIGCDSDIASTDAVANQHDGSYDAKTKKWVAHYDDASDRQLLSRVTHVYPLKTVNGSGFARTTDEITGDPNQRIRFFSYCIFHGAKALCGDGKDMKLSDPKGNLLPYELDVLRTVEFIDPDTAKPAGPANAVSDASATP